ncbi:MAG: hypothetical protein AAF624_13945 [Bacteroidota bacterium]
MPGYALTNVPDGALAVLPVQGVPVIANPDEITRALGPGVPDEVYSQFFRRRLAEVLPSEATFDEAALTDAPAVTLTPRRFRDNVRFPLPADGTALDLTVNGTTPAFALFLGNAQVRRGERRSNPNAGSGFERLVILQVDYVFWDVAKAQPAVAGRASIEAPTSVTNPVSQTFFERRTEELVEAMVRDTPFER